MTLVCEKSSESLFAFLIELRNYGLAAEIVVRSREELSLYIRVIRDLRRLVSLALKISSDEEKSREANFVDLQRIVNRARTEVAENQKWQHDVLESLPKEDDDAGLTRTLRQAFKDLATTRTKLLNEIARTDAICSKTVPTIIERPLSQEAPPKTALKPNFSCGLWLKSKK
jgi:hypothetical protein